MTITGSGTEYVYNGTSPTLTPGGNLTVTNGSTITDGSHRAIIDLTEGADISNLGDLTISGAVASYTIAPIYTTGGAQATTVTNSGTLSAVMGSSSHQAVGIYYNDNGGSSAAVTVTNSGSVYGGGTGGGAGGVSGSAVYVNSNGHVSVTNTGTMSSANTGHGYVLLFNANNASGTANNSGTITAQGIYAADIDVYALDDLTVTNSGPLQATGTTRSGYGIEGYSQNGTTLVTNSGAITVTGGNATFGYAQGIVMESGSGSITIGNSGVISAIATDGTASGLYAVALGGGDITITNSSSVTATTGTGTAVQGIYAADDGAGNVTITNSASGVVNSNSANGVTSSNNSISAYTASGTSFVTNNGSLFATSTGTASTYGIGVTGASTQIVNTGSITGNAALTGTSSGIYATVNGTASITNSGTITSTSKYFTTGIGSHSGSATINNSGSVAAVSGVALAAGLYINAVAGNTSVTNSGRATGTSTFSGPGPGNYGAAGAGISTYASGTATVVNNGYAGGFSSGSGVSGTGISADSGVGNSILVTNNGTAIGTTEGIALANSGTVNNYGLASGGLYSIYVLTGSTVNLDGASPVSGLLKGGTNDTSTSQLNFDIAIDGNRLSADETALNAAIAQYNTALTNAVHGAGHDVDSEVVALNGIDYQWEDFAGVADNLVQGRLYGATPGYSSEGSVLDNLPNNAASNTILNALGNVSDADVAAALSELSPQQLQVFRNVAFDNNTFNVAKINNHLANRRDGATGFDSSQLTVHDPTMDGSLDQVRSHLLAYNNPASSMGPVSDSGQAMFGAVDMKDAKDTQTVALATAPADPWSTFIAGDVLLANLSNSVTQQNSDYTTGSVTAGFDYQLDDHFTLGALFSYSHTDASLDTRGSSATVDSYTPGIYASYVNQGWYANFLGAYSRNAYTSDRIVDIPGLGGDNHGGTSGNQGSANFTGGYEFQKGAFKFGPIASLQYVHLAVDAMQEQGPTALSINSQDQDSLRSQLGLEGRFVADVNTPIGPMTLTPHLSASWQHEYMDSSGGITSQFTGTGGGSFVTQTQPPDRDAAFIDVGLDANIGRNVTIFADYETQAGQQNYFAQSAQGGVKIGF